MREGGGGGASSAMPHKQNPVGAMWARAGAALARGPRVRADRCARRRARARRRRVAGGVGGALRRARDHRRRGRRARRARSRGSRSTPSRMRANLDLTGGRVVAERLASILAERLGRTAARELVREASLRASETGESARRRARQTSTTGLTADEIDAALDPTTYLGSAGRARRPGARTLRRRARKEGRMSDDEIQRAGHGDAAGGARRRARRPRDRAHDAVHRGLPGSDHALRVGRDLVTPRPRPSNAQLHHPDRARRDGTGARARAARAGGAAERRSPATRSARSCSSARSTAACPPRTGRSRSRSGVFDEPEAPRRTRDDVARSSSPPSGRPSGATAAGSPTSDPTTSPRSQSPRPSSEPECRPARSRTSGSAAPTRPARTTATSRASPHCSRDLPEGVAGVTVNRLCASGPLRRRRRVPRRDRRRRRPVRRRWRRVDDPRAARDGQARRAVRPRKPHGVRHDARLAVHEPELRGALLDRDDGRDGRERRRAVGRQPGGPGCVRAALPGALGGGRTTRDASWTSSSRPASSSDDEHPRPDTSAEKLGSLRPAFRTDGTVTAGNASGINDGAAALVIASEERARELGVEPLGAFVGSAVAGVDPAVMGIGPVPPSASSSSVPA